MIVQLLHIIFEVVAPVGICASIGFIWIKRGKPYDTTMVVMLVTNVGVPSLVFSTLTKMQANPTAFAEMGVAAFSATIVFYIIGWTILKLLKLPIRTFLNPVVFGNTGNMAMPLCLLAFGQDGLALAIAFFVVNVSLLVTVGVAVASGKYRIMDVLNQPFVYAIALAVFFMVSGVEVPKILSSTTGLLGNFTIPLMLITLGVSLAKLQITRLSRAVLIAVLRVGVGIAVGFIMAPLFGLEGAARGVFVIECAMPVAVMTYLLAERYGPDGKEVAGAVIVSTCFAFLSMPLLIWILRY